MKINKAYKNVAYRLDKKELGNIIIKGECFSLNQDFLDIILFFEIEPLEREKDKYAIQVFVMPLGINESALQFENGQPLLDEPVIVEISEELLELLDFYQKSRRIGKIVEHPYFSRKKLNIRELEDKLSGRLYKDFFEGDLGIISRDFISLLFQKKIKSLDLTISSTDSNIKNLPWEILTYKLFSHDDKDAGILDDHFGINRTSLNSLKRLCSKKNQNSIMPLKLLFITALPENLSESNKMLEVEEEQRNLIEAIGSLEASEQPKIVIEFLDNASLHEIDSALKARKHDIIHISGHGSFNNEIQKGVLYLEDDEGNELQVKGKRLGQLLSQHKCIKLLMLSACETAISGNEGLCEQISFYSGIPIVLGMRFTISDIGAKLFTTEFYEHIAKGQTLKSAIMKARHVLKLYVQNAWKINAQSTYFSEWFTPVIYLNQHVKSLSYGNTYDENIYRNFYPKITFEKGINTKFVGQGFIGRKSYFIRLRRALISNRIISLYGLGGMGKTTLVEAFTDNYRKRFGHQIFMFRGDTQISEVVILEKLFEIVKKDSLDSSTLTDLKKYLSSDALSIDKLQLLLDNLKKKKAFLIFDNFEDVQEMINGKYYVIDKELQSFIEYLILHLPTHFYLLFTTRYFIEDLKNEIIHIQLDKMSYAEQYRFMNYSEHLRYIPTSVRKIIYNKFDGHPRSFEYLESLKRNSNYNDWQDIESEIESVEKKIFSNLLLEKIYNQISQEERFLLHQAGVLISRSPIDVLVMISGKSELKILPLIRNLQKWALLYWEEESKILEVHALIREWLNQHNKIDHEIYKKWTRSAGDFFWNQRKNKNYSSISNGILVKKYFKVAEQWEGYAAACFYVHNLCRLSGFFKKAEFYLNEVRKKPVNKKALIFSLNEKGLLLKTQGFYEKAINHYKQCLLLVREIEDLSYEAMILNNIGQTLKAIGKFDDALRYFDQCLEIHKKINDREGQAVVLNNIALILKIKGDKTEAFKLFKKCLKIFEEINSIDNISKVVGSIGNIYLDRFDYKTAHQYFQRSYEMAQKSGNLLDQATALNLIGRAYDAQERLVDAEKNYKKCLEIQQKVGDRIGVAAIYNNFGFLYQKKGKYDIALDYFKKSLEINRAVGDTHSEQILLNNIGHLYLLENKLEKSIEFFYKSLGMSKRIGDRMGVANVYLNLGYALTQKKDYERALEYYQKSLEIYRENQDTSKMALVLNSLGAFYCDQNKYEIATHYLMDAYSYLKDSMDPNLKTTESYIALIVKNIGEKRFQSILEEMLNNLKN